MKTDIVISLHSTKLRDRVKEAICCKLDSASIEQVHMLEFRLQHRHEYEAS